MEITHKENPGYSKPTEVISQHYWADIEQVSFYGWISDDEESALEVATECCNDSLVAIFKIKYK